MVKAYEEANVYRYTEPARYIARLNEYYKTETFRRTKLFEKVRGNKVKQIETLRHISKRENFGDFMVDWCWTYDPRLPAIGLPANLPWIPFPRQLEFIEWFYNLYLNQRSGLVEKSRDMGITWLFCAIAVFEWRWAEGFAGGIGSNKLDNVDKRDEPDSIFEKIRKIISLLPKFWLPNSFDSRKHDKMGNLVNPVMHSQIGGQGGKDIGRGGRRSFYLVDEAASLDFPQDVDNALSQNTNCQIDLSTPKGMNHFGQKRFSGKVPVFTFHWRDDPRKNEEWYNEQCNRLDPVVIAQELDVNYHASVEGLFIKPEWVQAAVKIKLKPVGPRGSGLDVAAGGSDKSSLAHRFGPVALVKSFNIANGVELTHMAIDSCNQVETDFLHYDEIGVGHAVYSTIERTEKKMNFPHFGMKASGSPSDLFYKEFKDYAKNVFINARSEWWYILAERFKRTYEQVHKIREYEESELISIENDGELVAQLSSTKKFYTETGKIKAESKEQMMKRGVKSPDLADGLILAFIPRAGGKKRILAGMDSIIPEHIKVNWNLPSFRLKHYGALVFEKDLSVHFMGVAWDEIKGVLQIYTDTKFEYPHPEDIVNHIIARMDLNNKPIDKLMANKVIFEDGKRSFQKEINQHLWNKLNHLQTVKLKEPRKYDPLGSVSGLIQLVKSKRLHIDINCKHTQEQFSYWQLQNAKFEHTGLQNAILLILSELIIQTPFQQMIPKLPDYQRIQETFDQPGRQGPMEV